MNRIKSGLINYITLFGSLSTLLCCALPAFLVSLGLGAAMAGLAGNVPGLIWISENKVFVFILSGIMLLLNALLLWKNRNAPCPIDPQLRDTCIKGRRFSRNIYFASILIFFIGVLFAFIL